MTISIKTTVYGPTGKFVLKDESSDNHAKRVIEIPGSNYKWVDIWSSVAGKDDSLWRVVKDTVIPYGSVWPQGSSNGNGPAGYIPKQAPTKNASDWEGYWQLIVPTNGTIRLFSNVNLPGKTVITEDGIQNYDLEWTDTTCTLNFVLLIVGATDSDTPGGNNYILPNRCHGYENAQSTIGLGIWPPPIVSKNDI